MSNELRANPTLRTCAECGKTGVFEKTWRWGSDPLGAYISAHLTKVFCSGECELRTIEQEKS